MRKKSFRRCIIILLIGVMIVNLFPSRVYAATGQLNGSITKGSSYANIDLTSLGDVDWAIWGYSNSGTSTSLSPDERMAGSNKISDLIDVNPGTNDALRGLGQYHINHSFNWSNGSGISSATGANVGIQHNLSGTYETGDGFSFTVPADTAKKRLIVYAAVHYGVGELTATLSDGSATQIILQQDSKTAGNEPSRYIIDYMAETDNQTLTVNFVTTWNENDGNGNVQIYAVAVSDYHTATINIKKDDVLKDAEGSVELRQNGNTVATATSNTTGIYQALVLNGTYEIYVNGINTGSNITINARDASVDLNSYTALADATTNAASNIKVTEATFNGLINAKDSSTTVTFEYGKTMDYGNNISATPNMVTGLNDTSVSATVSGLESGTIYHYRVVAVNLAGTKYGEDMTFVTPCLPETPSLTLDGTIVTILSGESTSEIDHYEYRFEESEDWKVGNAVELLDDSFPVTVYARAIDAFGYVSLVATETYYSSKLQDLVLSTSASTEPSFNPDIFTYSSTVENNVTAVSIKPVAQDSTAIISINGVGVNSGDFSNEIPLEVGINNISICVSSFEGTISKTYTCGIYRNEVINEPQIFTYSKVYDGNEHTFYVIPDVDESEILYTTEAYGTSAAPPSYTEIGTYNVSYVIRKDGYDDYMGSGILQIKDPASMPEYKEHYIQGKISGGQAPYTICLMNGQICVMEVKSDNNGEFVLQELESGIYNLTVKDSSDPTRNMVVKQLIGTESIDDAEYNFPVSSINSAVEMTEGTPEIIVGNLMEEAKTHEEIGKNVNLILSIEKDNASGSLEQKAIEGVAEGRNMSYMKISVDLEVDSDTTSITSTNEVIEIMVPYNMTEKKNIAVYRYHAGEVQKFNQIMELEEPMVDATYYIDRENNYVVLFTSKFSEYAIGYEVSSAYVVTEDNKASGFGVEEVAIEEEASQKDNTPQTGDRTIPMNILSLMLVLFVFAKISLWEYEMKIGLAEKRRKDSIRDLAQWVKKGKNREFRLNVAVVILCMIVFVYLIKKKSHQMIDVFMKNMFSPKKLKEKRI